MSQQRCVVGKEMSYQQSMVVVVGSSSTLPESDSRGSSDIIQFLMCSYKGGLQRNGAQQTTMASQTR